MKIAETLKKLSSSEKDELILSLYAEINKLNERIKALESRLSKDSHNSSKPPSTDQSPPPKKRTQSLRQSSNKNSGGQRGHSGETLRQTSTPTETKIYEVNNCECCGVDITTAQGTIERRQVYELPQIELDVIEHQIEIKKCPQCGYKNKAQAPQGVKQPVQYGPRFQALSVYMNQYQLLPLERTAEFFEDVLGHRLSEGSITNINERCYNILEPVEMQLKHLIRTSKVVGFDESGCKVASKPKYWFHVATTDVLTLFSAHRRRGQEGMEAMGVLNDFKGIAVHDFWKSYFKYGCQHALCNAHHLRELIFIHEQHQQPWALAMLKLLVAIKRLTDFAKSKALNTLPEKTIKKCKTRYHEVLAQGLNELPTLPKQLTKKRGRPKKSEPQNLHERLTQYARNTLAFMYDFDVPFDNNQSERAIRMLKVKLKISGTFRSVLGAEIFARTRSYIATAKKNGKNILNACSEAFQGDPYLPEISDSG